MKAAEDIYASVLENDLARARGTVTQYIRDHGLRAPALPVEPLLAVFRALGSAGRRMLARRAIGAMACHPQASAWHHLFCYWSFRDSLGFVVTLDLLEQLESQVLGVAQPHAPLRDLIVNPGLSSRESLISQRDRRMLSELAARPVACDPQETRLFALVSMCMRAHLYASGYWQRSARDELQRGREALDASWPELARYPLLATYVVYQLLCGHAYLREWAACEDLIDRLRELPGACDDRVAWEAHIAELRGDAPRASQIWREAEAQCGGGYEYWLGRAAIAIKREDFGESRSCLEKAMTIEDHRLHTYYGALGMCCYRLGDYDEAIRLWKNSGNEICGRLADGLRERVAAGTVGERITLDIPSIFQKPNHCGPCALAMLGRFWGAEWSQEEIASELSPWGTQLHELVTFAEKRGMAAQYGSRNFDAVIDAVRAGFPVLLTFNYPGGGHFVIANGYDPNLDRLEIRDPDSTFVHLLNRERYDAESGYIDHMTAVICPPDRVAHVPVLQRPESVYRDLATIFDEPRSPQAICESLRQKYADEELASFTSYADIQLRWLLDDRRIDAARKLAGDILDRHNASLYACSRVAEAFLRASRIQDAYDAVCRAGLDGESRDGKSSRAIDQLLAGGRSPSHEYLEFIRARCAEQIGNLQVASASMVRSINRHPIDGGKFLALADLMGRLGEEHEQLKYLDIAQQISGPNARAALKELSILRREENYAAAMKLVDDTIAHFPEQPWLWLEKGQLCEDMLRHGEAADCYRRVVEKLPDWHVPHVRLLALYDRTQNLAAAEQVLARVDAAMGANVDRWCVRAYWFAQQHQWNTVLEMADRCLAEAPMHTWAMYFRSAALEETGQLDEATAAWLQIVEEADPSDYYWDVAVAALGRLGRKREDLSSFERAFQRAIDVAPDSPSLWNAMCDRFRFSGRGADAHQYFERLYQRVTDKAGLALMAGNLLLALRAMPEARAWYDRIPPRNVAFPEAVRGIVSSLREESRLDEATALLRETLERHPSADLYSLLIDLCLADYEFDGALQALVHSLDAFPNTLPDSAYRLVRALEGAGATEVLESLAGLFSERSASLSGAPLSSMRLATAYTLKQIGKLDDALRACLEVLEADPVSGLAWVIKAEIEKETGEFDAAIASVRRSCATRYAPLPFHVLYELLRDMGRIDEAFDVCIEALQIFPGELSFQEDLDQLVLEFQRLDRYVEACQRLFPLVEDKATFLGNQATVFWRLGDNDRARQLYEQALLYGDYNWLHAQLGVVRSEEGDLPGAERELRAALQSDPHYAYAAERLAKVYANWYFAYDALAERFADRPDLPSRADLLERIHAYYRGVAETLPNVSDLFRDYCLFCVRCGDLTPAAQLADRYAEDSAVYSAICTYLADGYERLHDTDAAYECLTRAVESDEPEPYKVFSYLRMGWHVETFRRDLPEALQWYRRAVAANPEEIRGYNAVTETLEQQGRIDEALDELLAGLDLVDDPGQLLSSLARTAVQARRWDSVKERIEACLTRIPAREAALAWLQVASGLAQAFDRAGAAAALERSAATCPIPAALESAHLSIALQQRDYDLAEQGAERLLAIDSDNYYGLQESSRLALRVGDVPLALHYLERLIKAGGTTDLLTCYAYAAVDLGAVDELLRFCDACCAEGQVRAEIHLLRLSAHHLMGDADTTQRLLDEMPNVDAGRLADAPMIVGELLLDQFRYVEAIPYLVRHLELDPQNVLAQCRYAGTMLALGDIDAARPYIGEILAARSLDYWSYSALIKPLIALRPDLDAQPLGFRPFFEPFAAALAEAKDRRNARSNLVTIARSWDLGSLVMDLIEEMLADGPFLDDLAGIFAEATAPETRNLDLADRVLTAAEGAHLHPVTIAQMKSVSHALRGDTDAAIDWARASRDGHGAMFSEMCDQLFCMNIDLGDLSDIIFDCMKRYHEGHAACSVWALLLLHGQGRDDLFEQGLTTLAAAARDYRLDIALRRGLTAAVAAAKLYRAQQRGDRAEQDALLREIAAMPMFRRDVDASLRQVLGLVRPG